jgi:hypothetical protein
MRLAGLGTGSAMHLVDVGEGHTGGAGVLGNQRDHAALPLGEVPLVRAKERLVAHDGAAMRLSSLPARAPAITVTSPKGVARW